MDQKISALTTNPSIDGTEEVPTARSGSNFKNTFNALLTWLRGLIPYDLSTAPSNSVPVLNAGKTALIPLVLLENAIEVDVAITAAIAGTWNYANGASGVGATLTRTTNGAFATTDGVTAIVGRTYLHTQWTGVNRIRGGAWALTTVGAAGAATVFTRMTNSDSTAELDAQVVVIGLGTAGRGRIYTQTTSSPTVGTSNIIYQTANIAAPSVAPTPITVAAAQALVTAGTVVVGRVYSITDSSGNENAADRIWVRGVGPDEFDQDGLYIDSVNNQRNRIIYRLDAGPTDEIIFRADNKGNEIFDIIGGGCISGFDWASAFWSGNKTPTGFILSSNPEQFIDNYIQESVTIASSSQTGTKINRNIIKQSASVTLTADNAECASNIIGSAATINCSLRIRDCIIGDSCTVDDGGFNITGCTFANGTAYTALADTVNTVFSDSVVIRTDLAFVSKTIDTTAGDSATIDSPSGRFRKDTSGATFTLTNDRITANSIILLTPANAGIDASATHWTVLAGVGSATITFNAAPTANFDMNFIVTN